MNPPARLASSVTVLGAGYVGLAAAACLADLGHRIRCIDMNVARINDLSEGRFVSSESGLSELIQKGLTTGLLRFELPSAEQDCSDAEFVFICLPTPAAADGSADLSIVFAELKARRSALRTGSIVVMKSTVPPNSSHEVAEILARSDVTVVSNPEFLREGHTVNDFMNPDRIVVGSDHQDSGTRVMDLYTELPGERVVTDCVTAELIKYASNAYLATRLTFVNSLAALATAVGANTNELLFGVGSDRRIGSDYLRPGPGWGGSCLPKDCRALLHTADAAGVSFELVRASIDQNTKQMQAVVEDLLRWHQGSVEGLVIALWGVAFKADTPGLSDSPSLVIMDRLLREGASLRTNDPKVSHNAEGAKSFEDMYEACRGADALIVLTDPNEYREADLDKVRALLRTPVLIDTKHIFEPRALSSAGLNPPVRIA